MNETIMIPEKSESYLVLCVHCNTAFNAMAAQWCTCDVAARSLRCTTCHECLCKARPSVKSQFWAKAPFALRQNSQRFRKAHAVFGAPQQAAVVNSDAPFVVVVDDDESMRSLVACFVEQLGYRTLVATSPEDAYPLALRDDVSVLITDALMPRVDGRELCRRVKASALGATKKVIVMTSLYTAQRHRAEAFRVFGVDAYLAKPVNFSLLSEALSRLTAVRMPAAPPV